MFGGVPGEDFDVQNPNLRSKIEAELAPPPAGKQDTPSSSGFKNDEKQPPEVKKEENRHLKILDFFIFWMFSSKLRILDMPSCQNMQFFTRNPIFRSKMFNFDAQRRKNRKNEPKKNPKNH